MFGVWIIGHGRSSVLCGVNVEFIRRKGGTSCLAVLRIRGSLTCIIWTPNDHNSGSNSRFIEEHLPGRMPTKRNASHKVLINNWCIQTVKNVRFQMVYQKTSIKSGAMENAFFVSKFPNPETKPYLNISCACVSFPPLQASFASGTTCRVPWFLWSKATAIRPTLGSGDCRRCQSLMQLEATLAIDCLVEPRGCRSHRHDTDLQDWESSSSP